LIKNILSQGKVSYAMKTDCYPPSNKPGEIADFINFGSIKEPPGHLIQIADNQTDQSDHTSKSSS